MGGGGIFMRYRGIGHIGFELAVDGGTTADKDSLEKGYQRVTALATASILYRIAPLSRFDWYLLAGLGAGSTNIRYGATQDTQPVAEQKFTQTEAHVGFGFDYKLTRGWVLSGDFRLMGLGRNDRPGDTTVVAGADKLDPAFVSSSPVPQSESGVSANFGISYYF
jgi:hypothetical protein